MTTAEMTAGPSATDALLAAGYGHRLGRFGGIHDVFSVATGEVVGSFSAPDAWKFLAALKTIPIRAR